MSADPATYDPSPAVLRILARRYRVDWIPATADTRGYFVTTMPPPELLAQAVAARVMPGTRDQRNVLIEILGICGILHSPGHPGYADAFIPAWMAATDWPSQRFAFGCYPTWWWKAEGGISGSALHQFLPQLN